MPPSLPLLISCSRLADRAGVKTNTSCDTASTEAPAMNAVRPGFTLYRGWRGIDACYYTFQRSEKEAKSRKGTKGHNIYTYGLYKPNRFKDTSICTLSIVYIVFLLPLAGARVVLPLCLLILSDTPTAAIAVVLPSLVVRSVESDISVLTCIPVF